MTRKSIRLVHFIGCPDDRSWANQNFSSLRLLAFLLCMAFASSLQANIDSGGGISPLGDSSNHSSIGSPYSTEGSATGIIEILYPTAPTLDPSEDSDGNGLPDSWEIEFFGSIGVNPNEDSDGDGTTNMMEFVAGTTPTSPASVFRPSSTIENGNLVLRVPTISGRNYRVWGSGNLHGTWTEHDLIIGDGSIVEWEYSLSQSTKYFLRIQILIP